MASARPTARGAAAALVRLEARLSSKELGQHAAQAAARQLRAPQLRQSCSELQAREDALVVRWERKQTARAQVRDARAAQHGTLLARWEEARAALHAQAAEQQQQQVQHGAELAACPQQPAGEAQEEAEGALAAKLAAAQGAWAEWQPGEGSSSGTGVGAAMPTAAGRRAGCMETVGGAAQHSC